MTERRMPRRGVLLLAVVSLGWTWLDPHARAREGNRLYDAGKYDEAATKYNEALVDEPDSAVLHGSLGAARYKDGKFDDAVRALEQVPSDEKNAARTARTAYNAGNAKYRLGQAAEGSEPQKALGLWAEALGAYRRALAAAPEDRDAKLNHEFVARKIAELKKKLEEQQQAKDQQQQQDREQQEQPQDPQQGKDDSPPQGGGEEQKEQHAEKGDEPQRAEEPPAGDPQKKSQPAAGERRQGEMSAAEAAALLDSQRDQEVRPDEIVKRLGDAEVAGPAEDW